MVAFGHELADAAVAHALFLRLLAGFGGQVRIDPVFDDIGHQGDGQRVGDGLAGGGVDGDPVIDRVAVDFIPGIHGEFGEAAGFAIDHAGTEVRLIEENLQAEGVVAGGFRI